MHFRKIPLAAGTAYKERGWGREMSVRKHYLGKFYNTDAGGSDLWEQRKW